MQRLYFILSTLIITSFTTSCASTALAQRPLEEYRMPTEVPSAAQLTATVEAEVAARTPPKDCPVTVPQDPPFTPPAPYSDLGVEGYFWYGSNSLWVEIPEGGAWWGLPDNPEGYTQKIAWWREGYVWNEEPLPPLVVTGKRLDGKAPMWEVSDANGSYAEDSGSFMMMGVDFPTLGCWKITGKYQEDELSFVVWVAP